MKNYAPAPVVEPEFDAASELADASCVETFQRVKEELEEIEFDLARKFSLPRLTARRELLRLARAGKLVEDEGVSMWHQLYSRYMSWARSDSWDDPPDVSEASQKGAAEAALFFCGVPCSSRAPNGPRRKAEAIS